MADRNEAGSATMAEPAANARLLGQEAAEAAFLTAWQSGRLAHGWLLAGPRGIGKETLAFRIARFVLSGGRSSSLDMAPDVSLFRRVAAGGHSDLFVLARQINEKTGKRRGEIVIDDARALCEFLSLTPGEGAWRVAIVDGAEDMNRNAANAVLKVLEEPSPNTLLLLVSHAPGRLLPTIRSRCWHLPMRPLNEPTLIQVIEPLLAGLTPEDRATLIALSDGSPGRAAGLVAAGGLDFSREVLGLVNALPAFDAARVNALGERLSAGEEGTERFRLVGELLLAFVARLVRRIALEGDAAVAQGAPTEESALAERLGGRGRDLDQWIEVWDNLRRLFARAEALDLERRQTLIGAFGALERAARG
ncbi:MAG: DNA polymerase III subunit delta' [Alphaproteobacteria bacterium]|nr:DNA polymerase III subunit delta' [Alphaproteobacteria bacterium]